MLSNVLVYMELGQRHLYFVRCGRVVFVAREWYESAAEFKRAKWCLARLFPGFRVASFCAPRIVQAPGGD